MNDEEPIEHDFNLVDLEAQDEHKTLQQVIKEKYSHVMELKDNLARAKFIISFLEQENNQLKAKRLAMKKEKFKTKKQEMKGKELVEGQEKDQEQWVLQSLFRKKENKGHQWKN